MATSHLRRVRLSIDVDLELRRRLKIAAASRDLSVRDYVEGVLRGASSLMRVVKKPLSRELGVRAMLPTVP